ncbi:MAG: class I SAM-dependent methyltransferase [Bacteroidetes bacterium]|nr:class I SAM-dependent methyltransferase [Bacteroidota bacterium]
MNDTVDYNIPLAYERIKETTEEMQFNMASDLYTGSLLKTLVASKTSGRLLELGTGTGLATAWIVAGMDEKSSLVTIENNEILIEVAKKNINDKRVEFVLADGYEWIKSYAGEKFDFIFADAMPGKYDLFEETINMLNVGGFYIIDDMLPQPNWPAGHDRKVQAFIEQLENRTDLTITKMNWSTGIVMAVKK